MADGDNELRPCYPILVFATSLSLFNFGYNTASIGAAIVSIDGENEATCWNEAVCLKNAFEKGCVVSACLFGAFFGSLFAGSVADRIGRRATLLWNNVFYIVGPIGMALAPNTVILAAARVVTGLGVGVASALVHVYISDTVPADTRGEYGAILVLLGSGGVLVAQLTGFLLPGQWRVLLGLSCIPAILQLLLRKAMPKSPFDVTPRETREVRVHGEAGDCSERANDASHFLRLPLRTNGAQEGSWSRLWAGIKSGEARKPLFIGATLQVFQQISGINVVVYYGPEIFLDASIAKDATMLLSSVISCASLAATLVLAKFVDKVGRRFTGIIGCAAMTLFIATLGLAFLVNGPGSEIVAFIAMLGFRVAFSISLGPLPYIITAEVFPSNFRMPGVALCWAVNWFSNFVVSLTFPLMVDLLSEANIFFMFAFVSIASMIFIWRIVPETSGELPSD